MISRVTMSIERRLPLSIGLLLVLVVGTLSWRAYVQVRAAARLAASTRLQNVAQQLASSSVTSYSATRLDMRRRADSAALTAYLTTPSAANRARALATM